MTDVRLFHGDCREVMATMPANSVHSIVCDPPYGLSDGPTKYLGEGGRGGFMNAGWDHGVPGVPFWEAALRVAKPGAMLLAFGGTRTHHRLMVAIEDAGWEIRDCLMWLYGSGFPKSLDIGKAIDKAAGRIGESVLEIKREIRRRYEQRGMTLSEFNDACGFEASGYLRESSTWASVLPSSGKWERIKSVIGCNGELDALFAEAEREVLGQAPWQNSANHFVPGADHTQRVQLDITAPATDAAKQWDGWGTALKPAWEPIIMARKPLIGTVAENVLAHGCGGLNVDACRIEANGEAIEQGRGGRDVRDTGIYGRINGQDERQYSAQGRWPANLCLDDEAAALLDEQAGPSVARPVKPENIGKSGDGKSKGLFSMGSTVQSGYYDDSSKVSRFFYVAKASRADRNSGVEELITWDSVGLNQETEQLLQLVKGISDDTMRLLEGYEWNTILSGSNTTGKFQRDFSHTILTLTRLITELRTLSYSPSLNIRGCILAAIREMTAHGLSLAESVEYINQLTPNSTNGKGASPLGVVSAVLKMLLQISAKGRTGNTHSTVKPTALMRWLVRLVTPPGGTVLDPFLGSGSTGKAAKLEGFHFVGIEIDAEYLAIAERRIDAAQPVCASRAQLPLLEVA